MCDNEYLKYFREWLEDGIWDLWEDESLTPELVEHSKKVQEAVQKVGVPTHPDFYLKVAAMQDKIDRMETYVRRLSAMLYYSETRSTKPDAWVMSKLEELMSNVNNEKAQKNNILQPTGHF